MQQVSTSPLLRELNPEQRAAVLEPAKRLLVLAGAGAGKTKTLIQKILHLIFVEHVDPSSILAITFTRNAAHEMVDRLIVHADQSGEYAAMLADRTLSAEAKDQARLKYRREHNWINGLAIGTFHGFGYKILRTHVAKHWDNRFKIINEGLENDLRSRDEARETPDQVLQQVIRELCSDTSFLWSLKRYILDHFVETKLERQMRKSRVHDGLIYTTLNGDLVRSKSERMIADWLYRHGIKYEYEPVLDVADFPFKPDFFIPEANLYLEHISNRSYDPQHKEEQFRKAGLLCVKTYEHETEDINHFHQVLENHLKGRLDRPFLEGDANIRFEEEFKRYGEEMRDFRRQLRAVMDKVKVIGGSFEDVISRGKGDKHDRISQFYRLAEPIFQLYGRTCEQRSYMDFNDILIHFLRVLDNDPSVREHLQQRFRYILVDEYQDVNNLQVQVVEKLLTPTTQLFCVGDDWQSIYGFRGSEVEHIVRFKERFPDAAVLPFSTNYRSSSTIVEASNAVISRNTVRLDKKVVSSRDGGRKIQIYASDEESVDGVEMLVRTLKEMYSLGFSKEDVLILFRRTKAYEPYKERFKEEGMKVTARTVHSAKGLEARVVFIVGLTERYFPNVWEGDRIYQMIKQDDITSLIEEERRLFYVAVTRAKEMLYLVTELGDESRFIKEMEDRYVERRNFVTVSYAGEAITCPQCGTGLEAFFKFCPSCGHQRNTPLLTEDAPAKYKVVKFGEVRNEHPAFERPEFNLLTDDVIEELKEEVRSIPMIERSWPPRIRAIRKRHYRSHEPWSSEEGEILAHVLERTNERAVLEKIFGRSFNSLKLESSQWPGSSTEDDSE